MSGTEILQTFGKYRLTERLAFGGMAEVFLGTIHGEAGFVKPVVIKRLHPRLNEDHEFVQMLIDEARITAQLHHTNICQVLDLGSVDGAYYIAMEYISGEDLRTLQDQCGRGGITVSLSTIVYTTIEILAGLDYAHRKQGLDGEPLGIIHRDISPQNILISYEGEVKIIDFGIAKARSRLVQTEAGVIKGKFRYMSPEQASGRSIDHRTDIFAAGVVLYELLRGGPHGMDLPDTEVLRRMRRAEFEPLCQFRTDIPPSLERVVKRALHLNPSRRFPTAEDFRLALLQVQQDDLGTPHGRSDMAALMHRLFDEERRYRRNVSLARSHMRTSRHAEAQTSRFDRAASETSSETGLAFAATTASSSFKGPADPSSPPPEDPLEDRATTMLNRARRRPAGAAAPSPPGDPGDEDDVDTGRITEPRSRSGPGQPQDRQRDPKWTRARFHGARAAEEPASTRLPTQSADGEHDAKPASAREFFSRQQEEPRPTPTAPAASSGRLGSVFRTLVGLVLVLILGGAVAVALVLMDVRSLNERSAQPDGSATGVVAVPDTGPSPDQTRSRRAGGGRRRLGLLHVKSQPAGARIVLCGMPTGKVTPARVRIQAQKACTLELRLQGHETYQLPVKLGEGKVMNVVATLRLQDPAPQRARATGGQLRVTSIQPGTVFIDDKPAGRTPRLDLSLSPGTYTVKIFFEKLRQYSPARRVLVRQGQTTRIHLEPGR